MAMWFSRITVMMLALLGCGSALAQWEKLPPMPRPSAGFALGADDGGITVIGGTNWVDGVKQWSAEISRFDPQALRWTVVGRLEEPLAYAVSDTRRRDGALVIVGGSNGEAAAQAFITVSNGSATAAMVPALPRETVLSAGGLVGDTFIVVGGSDDAANIAGYTSRAFGWDLTRKTVTALPDYPGRPFGMAAGAVAGGELWVFGGANANPANGGIMNTGAAYAFSLAKKQWRALKACPLAVRGPAAVALDEHRVYLAGGWGGTPEGFVTAAFIYDGRTNDYTPALPLPYAATASLVRHGEYVYCLGGEDGPRQRSAAVWRVRVGDL